MAAYYNPYQDLNGNGEYGWKMANFHVHSLAYDENGAFYETAEPFKARLNDYKIAGYNIVMLSGQGDWFDTSQAAREVGMTTYNGQEHVLQNDGVLLVDTKRFLPQPPQEAIDICNDEGGFAILCHPNQTPDLPLDGVPLPFTHSQLEEFSGAVGVEIYNGCLSRRAWKGVPFGRSLGVDFWDRMLSKGRVFWGFANDDSHDAYEVHVGWTEIYARSTNFTDIKRAVMRGSLCASRGLRLKAFKLEGDTLSVQAGYTYHDGGILDYRFIGEDGKTLKQEQGASATYKLAGNEKYVRVEATGPEGSCLWTQPVLNLDFYGKDWKLG